MKLIRVLFILLSVFVNLSSSARPAESNRIFPITGQPVEQYAAFERSFINFMNLWHVPGASVAIVKNGKLVYARGFGWGDLENAQPVQPNSLFRIASVSKTFTAVTILKLAQEHLLNLNDPIFNILNNMQPLNGKAAAGIQRITVLDLLHMSSGWFSGGIGHIDPMFGPWPRYMSRQLGTVPASCYDTVRMMMDIKPRYRPGSIYAYSNLDYCTLGLIINKVTHQNYSYLAYQNYVNQHLLFPLGITNMSIGGSLLSQRKPGEVRYYRPATPATQDDLTNSFYFPYSDTEILEKNFGNAGWLSTAPDLARFMYDLRYGHILNRNMLYVFTAKPSFIKKKAKHYYSMGMQLYTIRGGVYWVQTGSFTGTNALTVVKPDGTSIAVIFNTRPSAYTFFTRFRPELMSLLISKNTL